jgi:hypothetical protein
VTATTRRRSRLDKVVGPSVWHKSFQQYSTGRMFRRDYQHFLVSMVVYGN